MNRKFDQSTTKLLLLSALLAFAAIACDFEPTTSFDGFDNEASQGVLDEQGATLRGTFQGGGGSALRAQRAFTAASEADELTVYVFDPDDFEPFDPDNVDTGEAIGSAPIVDGRFTLRGLPDEFILVFVDADDKAVGDPMTFAGVRPNQELDIVVMLDGDDVVLLDERRTGIDHDDLELNGPAFDVEFDPDNPMNGSLNVDDHHVVSRAGQTSIRKGNRSLTLEDIEEGTQVKVRGIRELDEDGNEQVFAQEIKLQDELEEEEDGEKITICHIPPGNPGNAKTITISISAWPAHEAHGDTKGACP